MILGLGTDVAEVARVKHSYQRHGQRFLDRVYTADEQAYCLRFNDPSERLAARWAAKEALFKALGSGLRGEARMLDAEVLNNELGAPHLQLHGPVAGQAQALGVERIWCSLSHSAGVALATVILEGSAPAPSAKAMP